MSPFPPTTSTASTTTTTTTTSKAYYNSSKRLPAIVIEAMDLVRSRCAQQEVWIIDKKKCVCVCEYKRRPSPKTIWMRLKSARVYLLRTHAWHRASVVRISNEILQFFFSTQMLLVLNRNEEWMRKKRRKKNENKIQVAGNGWNESSKKMTKRWSREWSMYKHFVSVRNAVEWTEM